MYFMSTSIFAHGEQDVHAQGGAMKFFSDLSELRQNATELVSASYSPKQRRNPHGARLRPMMRIALRSSPSTSSDVVTYRIASWCKPISVSRWCTSPRPKQVLGASQRCKSTFWPLYAKIATAGFVFL